MRGLLSRCTPTEISRTSVFDLRTPTEISRTSVFDLRTPTEISQTGVFDLRTPTEISRTCVFDLRTSRQRMIGIWLLWSPLGKTRALLYFTFTFASESNK